MLRTIAFSACLLVLALPAAAQDIARAQVLHNDKDRTGKRFANRYSIRCDAAGQLWNSGELHRATRKAYVRAGATALRVGVAAPPNSIGEMLDGSKIRSWTTLAPGKSRNFGNPSRLIVVCEGAGTYYAHLEWNRKQTSLFDLP